MTTYIVKHKGQQVGIHVAPSDEHALETHLNSLSEDFGDDGHYTVEPKPYEGPWCVCLYLVDRAYGGPEEGGWYYGCGVPVIENDKPLPSWHNNLAEATAAMCKMDDLCEALNEGRRDIGSVLSEGLYRARICDGAPKPYPETKPHYE